ncbi:hypothetical protein D9M68_956550 [compost metagenome]
MVCAMMTLMHLFGLGTERQCQHLMTEADAEDWQFAVYELLDRWHGIFAGCCRVAGTIGKEDAVWIIGENIFCRGRGWQYCDLGTKA